MVGIYRIENIVNHKRYIGQSIDIKRRWRDHKTELRSHRHFNYHLQQSWDKYGEDSFKFTIIEECLKENLDIKETFCINKFNCLNKEYGYNLVEFPVTYKQSQETRDKISRARTGMKFSKEHIEHIRKARLGTKSTEETKAKLREIHKNSPVGEKAYNAKMTEDQAKEIVEMLSNNIRIRDITKLTNVPYDVIKAIKQKRSWRHLTKKVSFPMYDSKGRIKEVS